MGLAKDYIELSIAMELVRQQKRRNDLLEEEIRLKYK